jgi:hypothetical protein
VALQEGYAPSGQYGFDQLLGGLLCVKADDRIGQVGIRADLSH